MTEEALDRDIEPDQLTVDESAVSEEAAATAEADDTEESAAQADVSAAAAASNATSSNAAATGSSTGANRPHFEHFAVNLSNCVNMELIDSAAIEFLLNLNTKNNRKKLTKKLFGVKRTRLDLLPFFGRLVATVALVSPEVSVDLAQKLKNEFRYHIAKKNQMNIESKIKVVRFIGELIKFGLYSKIEGLFCLKVLLLDFQHHQIEMTCALLEVAGTYLFNCKESRLRTNVYLEQMMRLKTANALDSRYVAQIENAYFLVKPPEGAHKGGAAKKRPPLHAFIRRLVYEELCKTNVDRLIKLMRRLPWHDAEVSAYAVRCLSRAYYLRYHLIRCLADLVAGLSSYQDKVVVRVIDAVFEELRAGLEVHEPKLAQRRIAMAKYLGELYNYRLVESGAILNALYSIVSLGVTMEGPKTTAETGATVAYQQHGSDDIMDPPESLFRLKLACVLLDTCGQYFTNRVARKRLYYFLVFLQRYYWWKRSHPMYESVPVATAAPATAVADANTEPVAEAAANNVAPIKVESTTNLFPILAEYQYKETLIGLRAKIRVRF